jgi:hypothetical protein
MHKIEIMLIATINKFHSLAGWTEPAATGGVRIADIGRTLDEILGRS